MVEVNAQSIAGFSCAPLDRRKIGEDQVHWTLRWLLDFVENNKVFVNFKGERNKQ